jgi:hypothetical protein
LLKKSKNTFYVQLGFFLNRAIYYIKWKNIVDPEIPRKKVRRMCIECWVTKATNRHSVCVMFIAFPIKQRFKNAPHCYVTVHCSIPSPVTLSDPQSIYIRSFQYRCSGKVLHVSAFCLLVVLVFWLSD